MMNLLIDSQADVCVIKQESLLNDININTNETIEITGVTKTPIYSLGTIAMELYTDELKITHKFHVMPNDFNIQSDGIIGRDFNKLYKCRLDYGTQEYTIRTERGSVTIPIQMHTRNNELIIPPRSESTRIFKIEARNPTLVKSKLLQKGLMSSNSIAIDGIAEINIINCTNCTQTIKMPKFETEPLENYNIYNMNKTPNNEERTEKLMKILSTKWPTDRKINKQLKEICTKYADIFALETDEMSVNNFYEQKLNVTDTEPVYTRNYRTPHAQKDEINRQVEKLVENNLVEPSTSNYNSAIILVPKKGTGQDKKWRLCIDYRKLNRKLVADRYPLPRIDDILDNLGRAKYFSVMDLHAGFHQVPLEEESRNITTFSTEKGSFRWKVLPFGLNVSPNSFSRMMSIAFSGLPPDKDFLYIDDIIVIGKGEREHIENLEAIFKILSERNLKLNPEKCKFFQNQVTFLGHKCTADGILPDETKLKTLKTYPTPHDKDATKRFVAFANYYRKFIPNFAEIAQPLSKLTGKKIAFEWTESQQGAFEKLKRALISPEILQYPDFEKQFIIKVDASNLGCAGVLLQEKNGIDMPVAYFSRSFQKGEKNKAIIEKELLAIYHSINQFRPYIYNTKFIVYTDHKPLVYLYAMKNPNSKLVRIKLELEEYDFEIVHIRGKDNIQADALSRIPFSEIKTMNEEGKQILAITRSRTKQREKENEDNKRKNETETQEETNDSVYEQLSGFKKKNARIKTYVNNENDGIKICAYLNHKMLYKINAKASDGLPAILSQIEMASRRVNMKIIQLATNDELLNIFTMNELINEGMKTLKSVKIAMVSPVILIENKNEQKQLLNEYHNDRIRGGHCGRTRLHAKLRSKFYWRNMSRDVAQFVKSCTKCRLNKPRPGTREPMAITPTPQKPFDCIIMDTIGPMTKTIYGNSYAVTIICDLTKYLITVPIPNKEAKTIAKAVFENFILIHGSPKSIRTDLGTEYKNEIISELCELLKIQHDFSTAYHHESLGSIERNHRIFNEYIRSYSGNDTWDVQLRYFTFCYNTSFNGALNHTYTPFELVFGRRVNDIEVLKQPIQPIYNHDNYIHILKNTLQIAQQRAIKFIEQQKLRNKKYYDEKTNPINIKINDQILIKVEPYNKFKPIFSGPYTVKGIENQNLIVEKDKKPYKIHKNRTVKI